MCGCKACQNLKALSFTNAQYSLINFQTAHKMTSQPSILAEQSDQKQQCGWTALFVCVVGGGSQLVVMAEVIGSNA